jgi:serine/threonine protein kinase
MSDSQKAGVMAVYNPDDIFRWDNLRNVDEPGIDFYTSIQARLKNYGEEFSTYAQAVWGKPFSNFLDSGPGHRRMDETWQPVRALGNGGFGMVGLWEKRNCQGVLEDSVAIKETERSPDYQLKRNPSVAKEAVIMRQLYDAEQRHGWGKQNNILRLRSFKFFPSSRKWRFYLEFAEYEDLYKLLSSYKTWDTYLPEEYLWHVFHSLAKVAVVMEQGPFTNPDTEKIVDGPVIHLDIKPDNVYLGKPDGKALFPHYPTIKMADFGMSEFTHPLDALNPRRYRKGTPDYYPPVSTSSAGL